MNIKHENHLRHYHPVRHAKHPKQILQTKRMQSGRPYNWFCWGGGGWQFMSSQNIYFKSFAGDNIYFHPTSEQTIYFKIQPIWIWLMQDYLFIFPGTQAWIFILRCLTARIFILKNSQPPPPSFRINCAPLNKKGTSFNHFPIVQ